MWWIVLIVLVLLYMFFDVNYFVRSFFTIGYALLNQKTVQISEKSTLHSLCMTQDVDMNGFNHLNNARFLRELDFARLKHYALTGILSEIQKRGGNHVQGACNVRYRRAIPIFSFYRIESKIMWWDDKAIYIEQQFISRGDNFVRAVAISKSSVTKVNVKEMMKSFPGGDSIMVRPEELRLWIEAIDASSMRLRN